MVYGDTVVGAMARRVWAARSQEGYKRYEEENQRRLQETDSTLNRPQREKMWRAYFLQYATVSLHAGDLQTIRRRTADTVKGQPLQSRAAERELTKNIMQEVTHSALSRTVDDRMRYLRSVIAPNGDFVEQNALALAQADAYAALCDRCRAMEANGEEQFTYMDIKGKRHELPLALFTATGDRTVQQSDAIRRAVEWHRSHGKIAETARDHLLQVARLDAVTAKERSGMEKIVHHAVRSDVLSLVRHDLARGEQRVEEFLRSPEYRALAPAASVQDLFHDIIHVEWNAGLQQHLSALEAKILAGDATEEDYAATRKAIISLCQEEPEAVFRRSDQPLREYLQTAKPVSQTDLEVFQEKVNELRATLPEE